MPKIYATTEDGRRILHEIECERCDATKKPSADSEGWTRHGYLDVYDEPHEGYYCPEHEPGVPGIGAVRQDAMARRLLDFERFKRKSNQ